MGRGLIFLVSGLVIIVGMTRLSLSNRISALPNKTVDYFYEQQARNISISLVDEAIQRLLDDNDWTGTINTTSIQQGSGTLTTYDQNTIGNLDDSVTVSNWDQYTVVLYSTATFEGYKVSTEVLMSRDSFSKYSYFTDNQPSNIYFTTNDELSGPVHTNGVFRIAGNPVFNGLVTSPNNWVGHSSYSNNPQFNGGSNFSAPNKNFDVSEQVAELKALANSNGLTFNEPILVVPRSDGTVDISKYSRWSGWLAPQNYDMSVTNGIISSTDEIDIYGTVSGNLTIHSERDIEIIGDVQYNDNPIVNPNSTDFLGLVAEQDIRVDRNAHSFSGTRDLTIQASLMALNSSFYVENYTSGGSRGTINLLGGMIQDERGPVGTFNSWGVASGFAKNYQYDERLRYNVPPSFPRERVFSILHWKDKVIERPSN